jgi:hypothetical protein
MDIGTVAMKVPGLGKVAKDEEFGWYYSKPLPVPMFGGKACQLVLEGYVEDERKEDFHAAISNFLGGSPEVLREVDEPLFCYYKDFEEWWLAEGRSPIRTVDELWQHVRFGSEPMVTRRPYGDKDVFISVECECDWEEEHGLRLVLKNGCKVNKLGGYDGHLTNSDAFADDSLEGVIYRGASGSWPSS